MKKKIWHKWVLDAFGLDEELTAKTIQERIYQYKEDRGESNAYVPSVNQISNFFTRDRRFKKSGAVNGPTTVNSWVRIE